MNALIFAAGLGTRLSRITKDTPKALVKVNDKPMLLHAIEKLKSAGVKRIVINVHHHASQVEHFVSELCIPGLELLISDERDELLETGGGLLKAVPLFLKNEPIIIYNADVLSDADLKEMVACHNNKKGLATLMVKKRNTSRYFLFDDEMQLSGWKNTNTGKEIITRNDDPLAHFAFSGVHIVNYQILGELGSVRKFSIVDGYLDLSNKYPIYGWEDKSLYWFDVGTPEKLELAKSYFDKNNKSNI